MIEQNKKIYLATPYSHEKESVRWERYDKVTAITAYLMQQGHIVFSPITYAHPMAERYGLPKNWEYWEKFDRAFMEWCDTVMVFAPEGYGNSVGTNAEINIAKGMGKPVYEITSDY